MERQVVIAGLRRMDSIPPIRKNAKVVQPRLSHEQCIARQDLGSIKCQCTVPEDSFSCSDGAKATLRRRGLSSDSILQSCFQVALLEINRGEKLARVRVLRIEVVPSAGAPLRFESLPVCTQCRPAQRKTADLWEPSAIRSRTPVSLSLHFSMRARASPERKSSSGD